MLSVQDLSITLGNRKLFNKLSFELRRGTITCITGKSGIGKSTLLECIAQLRTIYDGTISCAGKDLKMMPASERASLIGFVFQQFNLFPHMTVIENCMQPLMVTQNISNERAYTQAQRMLTSLGMQEYRDAYPIRLSGGQQQRVALARALCLQPQVLCLDEPTSALDADNSQLLADLLRQLSSHGTTIVCTSHDDAFINELNSTIITL